MQGILTTLLSHLLFYAYPQLLWYEIFMESKPCYQFSIGQGQNVLTGVEELFFTCRTFVLKVRFRDMKGLVNLEQVNEEVLLS